MLDSKINELTKALEEVNKPKTEKGQQTYNKILNAAKEIFGEKNYYNTSINEIADKAGVAPGTFYIYFPNKKVVFKTLVLELSNKLRDELNTAISGLNSRKEIEKAGFKAFFSFINKNTQLYKIVWQAQFVEPNIFKEYYQRFANSYKWKLKEAIEKDEIKDLEPEVLAYCLIGISNFIGLRWVVWDEDNIPEDTLNSVMNFIFKGMLKN